MAGKIAKRPLGAVLDRIIDHRGRTPKKLGGDFALDGVRTLSAKNVKEGRIDLTTEVRYVTREMHNAWMPHKLQIGDVLLTSEAPLGETAYLRDDADFCLGQRLFALRGNPRIITGRYLYYVLRSTQMQQRLHARATGTTAQGIRQSELLKVEVDFHTCIHEQRAIAGILGALDDKIELNRRMNRTLEAIARALFKSWFIDFDPVIDNALRAGHPIPDALADRAHVRKRLLDQRRPVAPAQDFHRLFPDTFTDSDLGPIPEGWEVGCLGDVARNVRRSVKPGEVDGGSMYIGLEHMPQRSLALDAWGDAAAVNSNKFAFRGGEILFGKLRPYFHKVGVPVKDGICSTDILVVVPKAEKWFGFALLQVSSTAFIEYTTAHSTGTRMPRTNWRDMAGYPLVIPPDGLVARFDQIVRGCVHRIWSNILESRTLASIRDTLLPKLLSGEIDASGVVSMAEEVC